ncbi:oligosaccharide flippase family protein [Paenibacillus sp. J5C_2022]|uniref:lipopolysaccharide biosynthesis protein n=1 Tax=Paenibacillus sp. J5C2022 TaxID=2977129 RepID=UPI0021D04950|nr:oligosaccharide flippase family protein [Paenibacillus sp. J5C2022]MCU6708773.1 oligosaccharide flippase family protein [Paenibacillus sp. J5C2022]
MQRLKKISAPLQASFWFVIASFLNKGVSMLTTPLYTRLMSPTDYGIVSLYNTWSGVFSVIITLSIAANAFHKGMVKFKDNRDTFISSMIGLTAVLVIIGLIIFKIGEDFFVKFTGLSNDLFYIMFAGLFLNAVLGFWTLKKKFDYDYKMVVGVSLALTIISQIVTYVAIVNANENLALVKIFYSALPGYIVSIIFAIELVGRGKVIFRITYWKFAVLFCFPLLPHYLSNHVLNQIDRIMIANYWGTAETAVYSVAYTLSSLISLLWGATSGVFVPWLYRKVEKNDLVKIKKVVSYSIIVLALASLSLMLLGPEIMSILGPSTYAIGVYAIPPVIAGVYLSILIMIYSNIEMYLNSNLKISIITILGAIINLILNLILIPEYGFVAAAYTTLVSFFIMLCFHRYNLKRISENRYFNDVIINSLIVIVVIFSVIVQFSYEYTFLRVILIIIVLLILVFKRKDILKMINEFQN